jgi:hypothetical protein
MLFRQAIIGDGLFDLVLDGFDATAIDRKPNRAQQNQDRDADPDSHAPAHGLGIPCAHDRFSATFVAEMEAVPQVPLATPGL